MIAGCTIASNTAGSRGGGVFFLFGKESVITQCLIMDNIAGIRRSSVGHGAGIYIVSSESITISDSVIIGNTAHRGDFYSAWGGGISLDSSVETKITNCLIWRNEARGRFSSGGGIAFVAGARYEPLLILSGCTVVENITSEDGGGLWCYEGKIIGTNCIVRSNSRGQIDELDGEITMAYSNIQGGWPGEGNMDKEARFVTGPLGDYYLSHKKAGQERNSPCINAGLGKPKELGLKKTTTRTDGKRDKRAVDMGWHYPR